MIEVKNLCKKFGGEWALRNNSWSLQKNHILGLLGPNGAGKSTTLKLLVGLLCPSFGEVLIDGENIQTNPITAKSKMGFLPEIPPLYEDLKVYDQLDFICGLKSISPTNRPTQIDRAIEKLKLNEVAFKSISKLSKGFRQRVGIAQTLLGDPALLIFDEPSVGLDPHQVFELRNIIKSLKADHTVVLSSHVLSEVEQICDQVVILDRGEVKAFGPLEQILNDKQGVSILEIKVDRVNEDLLTSLKKLPMVKEVLFNKGQLEISLTEKDVKDINPYLQEILKQGIVVQSIHHRRPHLEDVFIEVTQ